MYVPLKEEFYNSDPPNYLQQGDLFQGIPLLLSPATKHLPVIRPLDGRWKENLSYGDVKLVSEDRIDSFEGERPEWIAVAADRALAALVTHHCDTEADALLFAPVKAGGPLLEEGRQRDNLFAGKVVRAFPLYPNVSCGLGEAFIDLSDLRQVYRTAVRLDLRVASMSTETQNVFAEHVARSFGRDWGFRKDETVLEDGVYRCMKDTTQYDLPHAPKDLPLKKGEKFPDCPNCSASKKSAKWHLISKWRNRY